MRDIVLACCRDEADLVAAFVDFYLDQGFDRACLVDNGSRDGTAEVIAGHPARDRIELIEDRRPGYDGRLLEYYGAFEHVAERWVFFLDIDELVIVPGGIKRYAERLPAPVNVLRLPICEMLPDPEGALGHPLLTARRASEPQRERKAVWRRGQVSRIACGKHSVSITPYQEHSDPELFIRHYHTRSPAQFRSKLSNRIETHLAIPAPVAERLSDFSPAIGDRWIERSRRLLADDGWGIEMRRLEAIPWTHDPAVRDWFLDRG